MRRIMTIFTALVLFIGTWLPAVSVSATEGKAADYREYEIDVVALKDGTDERSVADQFIEDKAILQIHEHEKYVLLTMKNEIIALSVEYDGQFIDAEEVDREVETWTVKFPVKNLEEKLKTKIKVRAETPFGIYEGEYTLQLKFFNYPDDLDTDPATPGEEPGDKEDQEEPPLDDGVYTIDLQVLHESKDESSKLDEFVQKPARLIVDNEQKTLELKLINAVPIQSFALIQNGEEIPVELEILDNNPATKQAVFPVENLTETIWAAVGIQAGGYQAKYTVRMQLDVDSIKKSVEETPDPVDDGDDPVTPPGDDEDQGDNKEKPKEEKDPKVLAPGKYTIDFTIYKDGTNEVSVMEQYVVKPAILIVSGEGHFIQLTLTSSSLIKKFLTEQDGQYVPAKIVSENKEDDTRVVEFPVKDLSQKINAQTEVYIPAMNYHGEYTVQIQFDPDSIQKLTDEKKQAPGKEKPQKQEPEKQVREQTEEDASLTFDRDADKGQNDQEKGEERVENVQTADTTVILPFLIMLILSAAMLIKKYKYGTL